MTAPFRIAIAGLGTVGSGVVKALAARGDDLSHRAGRALQITAMSARDNARARGFEITGWRDDPLALAGSDADVVVELIGGEEGIARALVERALSNGKHVVTANKALLAKHGLPLAKLAEDKGVSLKFEAAAAGGIPIVKVLREDLIAHGVDAIKGILNGTCNYILTEMEASGRSFAEVLKEAQAKGYAEADPALDVGGGDTAHKLCLLSSLAFGTAPDLAHVAVEGITHITADDIAFASEFGFRIKLLGVARRVGDQNSMKIDQKVHPAMVRARAALANVSGAANGVLVDAGEAGSFFFSGRGAGEAPTASAVIADIVEAASEGDQPSPVFGRPAVGLAKLEPADSKAGVSPWYLRFEVLDVPGVLAAIARHLADAGVSIESMIQRGRAPGEPVAIVMITHETAQGAVERALKAISASDKVRSRPCMIPMES
ncbi:MAG TPA: homoserine dehydrogenase [Rhizomicrobium sp.]|jgi:homoserine dehydrogenase|nr:homoserine dehydrogenase [Rhizomicrobium sp.]